MISVPILLLKFIIYFLAIEFVWNDSSALNNKVNLSYDLNKNNITSNKYKKKYLIISSLPSKTN